jgi:hypothetical protein
MKGLLKKEHKITTGSQGQTCFIWSKNVRDLTLGLKPGEMNLAEILDIFPALGPADHGADSEEQDIVEGIINLGMLARVVNIIEKLSENSINRHEGTPEKGA